MDGIKGIRNQVVGGASVVNRKDIAEPSVGRMGGPRASQGVKTAEDAAQDFEALLLKQMLSEMWQTIPKEGVLEGGRAEEMYYDMFHESVADSIAENGGIGIKEELLEDMKRQERKGK
jgi:Rod binding domain-containing protein